MLALFDEETLMKNHDATIERKSIKKGRKETTDLLNYLWTNNRGDDAIRASEDEQYLEQLLADFRDGKL